MGWAAKQKEAGIKLELTWFEPREYWKKKHSSGKVEYFKFPDSAGGYADALQAWFKFKSELNGTRLNVETYEHHQRTFERVKHWYDSFGVPATEQKLFDQVTAFLKFVAEWLALDELPFNIPMGTFSTPRLRPEFRSEFFSGMIGFAEYELPAKWIDRLDRSTNTSTKEPQTIGYWLTKYLDRIKAKKSIVKKTSDDRKFKLIHFQNWCDKLAHIETINSEYLETYHAALDDKNEFQKKTKQGYFKTFRMFVRWAAQQTACDLATPANLERRDFTFRDPMGTGRRRQEQKKKLWSPEEFTSIVATLSEEYECYLMLMLNCGFRHVDLGELQKVDLKLKQGRIVIQRHKLNQKDTAPVISYKLWPRTLELVRKRLSDDPKFAFRNSRGGTVEDSIKSWWKDHTDLTKGKLLSFLRKTGCTMVDDFDANLGEMYLGECLKTTTKIHYSFKDGEPCQALDDAIGVLGAAFGFCEEPVKRVMLTAEVLETLRKAGVDIATLKS